MRRQRIHGIKSVDSVNKKNEFYHSKLFSLLVIVTVSAIITVSSSGTSYAESLIATVPAGSSPTNISNSPNYVYVTNYNSGTVSVIDGITNAKITDIQVGAQPYGIVYDSYNNKVYVANSGSNTVSVIDPSSNTVVANIPTAGSFPDQITYDSANNDIYVANYGSNTVSVIDPSSNTVVNSVPVGVHPYGIAYESYNNKLYVANFGSDNVSVIDPSSNTVVSNIPTGGSQPSGIAYDSTNNDIYVANYGSNNVSVIDPSSNTVISTVQVGTNPIDVAYGSSANNIYVANHGSNNVSVIDPSSNTVVNTIPVGLQPSGLVYDSSNNKMYVANSGSDTVSVIDPLVDKTPPNLTTVSITSSNANPIYANVDDTVTLSFTSNEPIQMPTVTIAGHPASVTGGTTSWTATYVMTSSDTEGVIPFEIDAIDLAGNAAAPVTVTTDGSSVTFNKTIPPLPVNDPPLSLAVPTDMTVYPDNHLGAVITYFVVVSGGSGATESCTPDSGTIFPMGVTTVTCTATDSAGNSVIKTFNVTVLSASQIADQLIATINNFDLPSGIKNSLTVKISGHSVIQSPTLKVNQLKAFANEVNAKCCGTNGKPLTLDESNQLITLVNHLRAALS